MTRRVRRFIRIGDLHPWQKIPSQISDRLDTYMCRSLHSGDKMSQMQSHHPVQNNNRQGMRKVRAPIYSLKTVHIDDI